MSDLSREDRELLSNLREDLLPQGGDAARVRASIAKTLAGPPPPVTTASFAKVALAGLGAGTALVLVGIAFWPKGDVAPKPAEKAEARAPISVQKDAERLPLPEKGSNLEAPVARVSSAPAPRLEREEKTPSTAANSLEPNSLSEEVRLLREADVALRKGLYATAKARLEEHRVRFPSGILAREREGTKVLVACRSEDSPSVRTAATEYLARVPSSPLTQRIEVACSLERK